MNNQMSQKHQIQLQTSQTGVNLLTVALKALCLNSYPIDTAGERLTARPWQIMPA